MISNAHQGCEPFLTLTAHATQTLTVQRSRFIAHALPVTQLAEADAFIRSLRQQHHDARHVCHGMRIGRGAQGMDRSSDDGEPARTGGYPLWQLLDAEGILDALIVVVRYFGGVKLGMGGLSRAYREAGRAAMQAAAPITVHPEHALRLTVAYEQLASVDHLLASLGGVRIMEREYGADVTITLGVRKLDLDAARARLAGLLERHPHEVGQLLT